MSVAGGSSTLLAETSTITGLDATADDGEGEVAVLGGGDGGNGKGIFGAKPALLNWLF